jgi:hypothetical protein
MDEALDEGLELLGDAAPEYEAFGGVISLANHGPMVIEALCAMGRDDAVVDWTKRYAPRLDEPPPRQTRMTAADCSEALGDLRRVRDWEDLFDAEFSESSWTDVLERWIPTLAPGMVGGIHGAIRAAHAVRGVGRAETEPRIRELARGLAYWAATYKALPEAEGASRAVLPSQAMGQLEQLDLSERTGWLAFTEPIGKLAGLPSFAQVGGLIDYEEDPSAVVADLARTFAAILLSNNPTVNPRALCHGLTAGTIYRMIAPHVSPDAGRAILCHSWRTAAAFYCALVLEPPAGEIDTPPLTIDEIIREAMRARTSTRSR